jgi:acetolactate synthase-1/2/3 large subunit
MSSIDSRTPRGLDIGHPGDCCPRSRSGRQPSAPVPTGGDNRHGGDLVIESLTALGATHVFGLPGQHALAVFDALGRSQLTFLGTRTENNAAFAADGFARATGAVAPLLVSTGPGALMTLPALQEAAAASVPILGISSQIPSDGLGGRRKGYWHELADQQASFRHIVKSVQLVRHASHIPSALAAACETALTAPHGPTWVEIPEDVLAQRVSVPPVTHLPVAPRAPRPRAELIMKAAELLSNSRRPAVLAGGGVIRAGACAELRALAERINAPVATTYGGKGAFPWEHPLSLQSWIEDRYIREFLESADTLLVIGSGLGQDSSCQHTLRPQGRLIQVEADLGKLEANLPALAIHADARLALSALLDAVTERPDDTASRAVAALRAAVHQHLASQRLHTEQHLLASVRAAIPDTASTLWDMTILSYWAQAGFDPRGANTMHSAQGAGGLGYAFPAALGVATADSTRPVLAVCGDGGAMYSIAELATARQHNLNIAWLIIVDAGYGILRQYQTAAYGGSTSATELFQPDFVALADAFDIPAVATTAPRLRDDLVAALSSPGPHVVVLSADLRMFTST